MGLSISPNIYKKKMSAILLFWHGKCNLFHWQYCTYHERILRKSFKAIGWDTTSGGHSVESKGPLVKSGHIKNEETKMHIFLLTQNQFGRLDPNQQTCNNLAVLWSIWTFCTQLLIPSKNQVWVGAGHLMRWLRQLSESSRKGCHLWLHHDLMVPTVSL
jgi:hypothetical protein